MTFDVDTRDLLYAAGLAITGWNLFLSKSVKLAITKLELKLLARIHASETDIAVLTQRISKGETPPDDSSPHSSYRLHRRPADKPNGLHSSDGTESTR